MKKIKEKIIFKLIEISVWMDMKRHGSNWDKFQWAAIWLGVITLLTWILGKIIN
jgi:hypothetical protein